MGIFKKRVKQTVKPIEEKTETQGSKNDKPNNIAILESEMEKCEKYIKSFYDKISDEYKTAGENDYDAMYDCIKEFYNNIESCVMEEVTESDIIRTLNDAYGTSFDSFDMVEQFIKNNDKGIDELDVLMEISFKFGASFSSFNKLKGTLKNLGSHTDILSDGRKVPISIDFRKLDSVKISLDNCSSGVRGYYELLELSEQLGIVKSDNPTQDSEQSGDGQPQGPGNF